MVSELANYLAEQLQKGYSRQQLKDHLLKNGYTSNMISSAFAELVHERLQQSEPDLKEYVESYISQGYKAEQLYASLRDEGYSKKLLDKTFRRVEKEHFITKEPQSKKRWKKPDAIAIMLALPIIFFILIFVYLLHTPSGEIPLVDDVTNLHANTSYHSLAEQNLFLQSLPSTTTRPFFSLALDATTKNKTLHYCSEITLEQERDACYQYASETYNDSVICESITLPEQKDNCYITFIIAGNTTFCDALTLSSNKDVCST